MAKHDQNVRKFFSSILALGVIQVIMVIVTLGIYHFLLTSLGGMPKTLLGSALIYCGLMLLAVFYILIFQPKGNSSFDKVHSLALISTFITVVPVSFAYFYSISNCIEFSDGRFSSSRNLYFSYLTFSTLGYGDGLPNDFCKPVSVLQSILGLVSLAAMISITMNWSKEVVD
jgi:hypothetical protein